MKEYYKEQQIKNEQLKEILFRLSKKHLNKEQVEVELNNLKKIYEISESKVEFRHCYSDIFTVISEVKSDEEKGNLEFLGTNFRMIVEQCEIEGGSEADIFKIKVLKLYDHISLDIGKLNYSENLIRKGTSKEEFNTLKSELGIWKSDLEDRKTEVSEMQKELKSSKKEYIAILGIFSAVVLAFTGGLAFSTSVLENMHSVSIYKVLLVGICVATVITNIIFGLFYYIGIIVFQNSEKKKSLKSPLIISNIIFLILLVVLALIYNSDLISGMDKQIIME